MLRYKSGEQMLAGDICSYNTAEAKVLEVYEETMLMERDGAQFTTAYPELYCLIRRADDER
jgi:hypothetical protein